MKSFAFSFAIGALAIKVKQDAETQPGLTKDVEAVGADLQEVGSEKEPGTIDETAKVGTSEELPGSDEIAAEVGSDEKEVGSDETEVGASEEAVGADEA